MNFLYTALATGGVLVAVDAWLRWQDKQAAAFAEVTAEDEDE